MQPPVRFVTTSDGVRIAYCVHGDGAQTLVLVRGWMSHIEMMWEMPVFRAFFEELGRHMRVVRFDMRAMGMSDRDTGPVDVDGMVRDIEAVVDALGVPQVVLYGQCYGGPPAIVYAARHPDRVAKLVLDGTYACGAGIARPERQASFLNTLTRLPEAGYVFLAHLTDPGSAQSARPDAAKYVASPDRIVELYSLAFATDVTSDLAGVRCPALVMHRRASRAIPVRLGRELASRINDATFVALPGQAHDAWQEEPQTALAALGDFLGFRADQPPAGQSQAPRTSVTILFTDMESSTASTQRLGDDQAQDLVHIHNTAVRDALRAHNGREIKHTGDGIMASFDSASHAVECAIAIQRALSAAGDTVRVSVGINAGEPVAENDDLFGTAVQLAARLCSHARPGQILASNVIRELTAGRRFLFSDEGQIELRGFEDPVRVYDVRWRD